MNASSSTTRPLAASPPLSGVGRLARAVRRQVGGAAERPLAAIAAACRIDIRLARPRNVADRKRGVLKPPDVVAQPRRLLELEIAVDPFLC